MGIEIRTMFNPLRMRLSRREPVELLVLLTNTSDSEKRLTIRVNLTKQLAFDKGGYRTVEFSRIDSILPKEQKKLYYKLYPKPTIQPQPQPITITVQEHYKNYQYTQNQYTKEVELIVE